MIAGLAGCGGAQFGDKLGSTGGGGGGTQGVPPASINIILSSATLPIGITTTCTPEGCSTGTGTVTVTAVVTDANHNTIEGAPVAFAASSGALTVTQPLTDGSGLASAVLTTGGDSTLRAITVIAASGAVSRTATVQVVSGGSTGPAIASLTLLPATGTLPSDASGIAKASSGLVLTALAKDANNVGVSGVKVSFTASSGLLSGISTATDANGIATATLTTGGDPTLRSITVTINAGGLSASHAYSVVNPQSGFGVAQLRIVSSSPVLAPTASSVTDGLTLTAFATNTSGNAVAGVPISFSASSGQLVNVVNVTDSQGRATAVLTTGGDPTPRTITAVTATIGSLTAAVTPPIQVADTTAGRSITLTSDRDRIAPDATSISQGAQLTATFIGPPGTSIAGVEMCFEATVNGAFANGVVTPNRGFTNSQGQLRGVVTTGGDPTPRDILVTAVSGTACRGGTIGDPEDASSQPVSITVRSLAPVATLRLVTSSNILSPDADTVAEGVTISAIALDSNGVALVGVPVTFATTTGALQQAGSRTDSNGIVTAILTTGGDPTPRTATVSGSADGKTGSVMVAIRRASSLDLSVNPAALPSDADTLAKASTVTATLLDEQGQPIANVPISFAAAGGNIQVTRSTTDAAGTAVASLTTGGNTTPRTITVTATATVGGVTLTRNITVPVVAPVAQITLLSSSPQLLSAASTAASGVTLTAIATDSNGNLVNGAAVAFVTSGGALQVTQGTTDPAGVATAVLTTGGIPTNRSVTISAHSSSVTSNVINISITGTTLTVDGPTVVGSTSTATFAVNLRDSSGAGIPNTAVTLASAAHNPLSPGNVTTNSLGQASFSYTGTAGGPDTITATSTGVAGSLAITVAANKLAFTSPAPGTNVNFSTVQPLTVNFTQNGAPVVGAKVDFTSSRGVISGSPATTNGSGNATVNISSNGVNGAGGAFITAQVTCIPPAVCPPNISGPTATLTITFVATPPSKLRMDQAPSTIGLNGSSTVTAVVYDQFDNLVANQQVDFLLTDVTGGALSTNIGITNSSGAASVTYTASQTPSATNGVRIDGTLHNFSSVTTTGYPGTPAPVPALITVSGKALEVHIGQATVVQPDPQDLASYDFPMDVIVQDSAGNPAPANTVVNLKVVSFAYIKGKYDNSVSPYKVNDTVACLSEDLNLNGILDTGEDNNTNGRLDPGNVAAVPATVTVNAKGKGAFLLSYPKNYATWVEVTVQATASVAGTEGSASTLIRLPVAIEDISTPNTPPGGFNSLYGVDANCGDTL